jgi:hypothetical protein
MVVRRIWATWAAPAKVIQAGAATTLMVRRIRRPWPVLTLECPGNMAPGQLLACGVQAGLAGLDGE